MNDGRTCTWKDCGKVAMHQQKGDGGRVWADLCDQHDGEINAMLEKRDAKGLLRAWVLASGGADKMVRSM